LPACIAAPDAGRSARQRASQQAARHRQSSLPEGSGEPALFQKRGFPAALVVNRPAQTPPIPTRLRRVAAGHPHHHADQPCRIREPLLALQPECDQS
jgi:hypothetical protein